MKVRLDVDSKVRWRDKFLKEKFENMARESKHRRQLNN